MNESQPESQPFTATGGTLKSNASSADEHQQTKEVNADELKAYGRTSLVCDLLDRAIDLVYLTVMAFVVAVPLDDWLARVTTWTDPRSIPRLVLLFFVVYGFHAAVSIGLSFYSGYVVEHRFQLSTLSPGKWLKRYVVRHLINAVISCPLYVGMFALIWTAGPWWWVLAAAAFFIFSILLGQLFPVLILPRFYETVRLEDEDLKARMKKLASGTGLAIEGIYRMAMSEETKKANAMLVGLGKTRRVLMGDTLLESFSPNEIEVIIAHEIGHHVHRHIPKLIALGLIYCTAGLWLCDRLLLAQPEVVTHADVTPAMLPLLMLSLTVFMMLLEPFNNLVSRHFERQSDRYALRQTGLRDAYRSAYAKLSQQNKADPEPHWLEVALFHSHPPINQRIAAADEGHGIDGGK